MILKKKEKYVRPIRGAAFVHIIFTCMDNKICSFHIDESEI